MNSKNNILYVSYEKLISDIRTNLYKIPKDILGVIGIPRSGTIPATIISEYLNVGLTTIDSFLQNGIESFNNHGNRKLKKTESNKILVVDDTCYNGNETKKNRLKLDIFNKQYEFIFMCIYLEGTCLIDKPDLYLMDIRQEALNSEIGIALYEWNIFHNPGIINKTIFDLDGVICADPPDERNTDKYIEYIKSPQTLLIPTVDKITICTYRLVKYKQETINYLNSIGLCNHNLIMFYSNSYEERSKTPSYLYKAAVYNKLTDFKLFIESDDYQARKIKELTGKSVFCNTTNTMY